MFKVGDKVRFRASKVEGVILDIQNGICCVKNNNGYWSQNLSDIESLPRNKSDIKDDIVNIIRGHAKDINVCPLFERIRPLLQELDQQ